MRDQAVALALATFALACNTPKEAHDGATAPASPAATSASPAASAPASVSKPGACTKDGDCRTFSSYCAEAPCACRVLGSADADPKCLGGGPSVRCFADPCMGKTAGCQNGACVLTAK